MVNLIQPITVQQAYDGITHAWRWPSWNWWWRKVDDDDGDGFPSPEPRTDSRSALPREIRAWRRLRIVKRDESCSLDFFSLKVNIWSHGWGRWSARGPTRQGARLPRALHPRGPLVAPPTYFFLLYIPTYPQTTRYGAKTLIPPPQPSVPVRSHLGAFSGAPPEGASITEGFYINTNASPMKRG